MNLALRNARNIVLCADTIVSLFYDKLTVDDIAELRGKVRQAVGRVIADGGLRPSGVEDLKSAAALVDLKFEGFIRSKSEC